MGRSYDDWKLSGNTHKCVCGALWTDSDGEPCHKRCVGCEKITDIDELYVNEHEMYFGNGEPGESICNNCREEEEIENEIWGSYE